MSSLKPAMSLHLGANLQSMQACLGRPPPVKLQSLPLRDSDMALLAEGSHLCGLLGF